MKPSALDPRAPAAPAPPPGPAPADAAARDARIAHIFRSSRRAGAIHPLQHLIQRYRAGEK